MFILKSKKWRLISLRAPRLIPLNSELLVGQPQAKEPIAKQVLELEPYCKHCGAELPKGQAICHVCGKKVD